MEAVSLRQTEGSVRFEEGVEEGQMSGRTVKFPTTLTHTIEASCSFLERLTCGHLVGGSYEGFLSVWETKEGFSELFREKVHDQGMTAMHAQPGNRLAVGFRGGKVTRFTWKKGKLWADSILQCSFLITNVCKMDTLPESKHLVVGYTNGSVHVFGENNEVLYSHNCVDSLIALKTLPDGRVALGCDGYTQVWKPGEEEATDYRFYNKYREIVAIQPLSPSHYVEVFDSNYLEDRFLALTSTVRLRFPGIEKIRAAETLRKNVLVLLSRKEGVKFFDYTKQDPPNYQPVTSSIDLKKISFLSLYALKVLDDGRLAVATENKILIYTYAEETKWKQ